ncbi:MAG: ABC transporter permease [Planctomycetota bacterium]|nr:ABC transporter permease [Planctomycetota bacterium]
MQTLSAGWALARKDLRSFLRDRTALVLSILVPIALVTVFGWIMAYAFGGGSGGMPQVRLRVADLSQSKASQNFVEALQNADMLRVQKVDLSNYQLAVQDSVEEPDGSVSNPAQYDETGVMKSLEKMVTEGDAHHILVIQKDFADKIAKENLPELRMLRDPGRQMEDRVIQIGVMQASMGVFGGTVFSDAMGRILSDQGMDAQDISAIRGYMDQIGGTIESFYDNQAEDEQPSKEDTGKAADENKELKGKEEGSASTMDSMMEFMNQMVPMETKDLAPPDRGKRVTYQQAQSVAGMTVMMLLFALTSCGSVLLAEREEGTLKRLFAQPVSRNSILLGKFLFVFVVGLGQMVILFTYGELMFRVGLFRDPLTLIVLSVTWVMTGGAFGVFLAAISRSQKQAESLASLLILIMAALGGCWFPLQMMNLPIVLETVCKSTMTYWAMTGFQAMLWNQQDWLDDKILIALCWQWGWAVLLSFAALFFYRRNFCRG